MSIVRRFAAVSCGALALSIGVAAADAAGQRRSPPKEPTEAQPRDQTAQPGDAQRRDPPREPREADRRGEPVRHPAHPQAPQVPRPAVRGQVVFVGGYFYDPFFGPYPWWPRPVHPRYFPIFDQRARLRIQVKPKEAAVYVDGYYAGIVDDFDGVMQALPLPPGGHDIALYLSGYRTVRRPMYLGPGSFLSVHETLERLPAGAASEPPPVAPALPPPPDGSYRMPRTPGPGPAPAPTPTTAVAFGSLDLQVQPATAGVTVDGRPWSTSEAGHYFIDLPVGTHSLEVTLKGYPNYAREVAIREGEATAVNVSLMKTP